MPNPIIPIRRCWLGATSRRRMREVAELYTAIFEGDPFFEYKQCRRCGWVYSEEACRVVHDGDMCRRPNYEPHVLELEWCWREDPEKRTYPALELYRDAIERDRFTGIAARLLEGGRLIGFSWGFALPQDDTPSVKFRSLGIAERLQRETGVDRGDLFYAAETGVGAAFRRHNVGSRIAFTRLYHARQKGFRGVCFRTINPTMVALFAQFFGVREVYPLFAEPDPTMTDREWFYFSFANMQSLPELLGDVAVCESLLERIGHALSGPGL